MKSQSNAGQAVARARPLKALLIEARAAVFDPTLCQDLNLTARRVLFGALTFLNLKNVKMAIFPRRDVLRAESLLHSEATLYRGLKTLEIKGYITRSQKRREHNGEFYLSPIQMTEKALAMLGLSEVIHTPPSAKMIDGRIQEHTNNNQSLQNSFRQAENTNENPIDRKTRLPKELLRLLDLGVERKEVCWLMGQAKRCSKRLAHVVEAIWHRIHFLTGKEVVGYINSMISKDLDYAWIAKNVATKACLEDDDRKANDLLKSFGEGDHRAEVFDSHGNMAGFFEYSASGLHAVIGDRGSFPVNKVFAQAVLRGLYWVKRVSPSWQTEASPDIVVF